MKDLNLTTFKNLENNKKSIIRWGDGEYQLMFLKGVYFQESSLKLSLYLWLVYISLRKKKRNLIFAYPSIQIIKHFKLYNKPWIISRLIAYLTLANSYYSPFLFREKSSVDKKSVIKMIKNERKPVFIGSSDFAMKSINWIETIITPKKNSFQVYKDILNKCYIFNSNEVSFYIACGPAGKIIAFELFKRGYRVVDLGHFVDYKLVGKLRQNKSV